MEGLAPVVSISSRNESPKHALNSILRCQSLEEIESKKVHIVKAGFDPERDIPSDLVERLSEKKVELILHGPALKENKLNTLAVMHVPADLDFHPSSVERLAENMRASHKRHSHFAVSTKLRFEPEGNEDWRYPRAWLKAFWYGFLNVVLMLDVMRSILNITKYHRACDLRAQTVTLTWPSWARLTPAGPWWRWWWGTRVCGVNTAQNDAVQRVCFKDAGFSLVARTIETHPHMKASSLLWLLGFGVYYSMFSYPWWNVFLSAPSSEYPGLLGAYVSIAFYRDVWNSTGWLIWYGWHLIIVAIVAGRYMAYPLRVLAPTVLLYPFYLAAFPLIYLVAKVTG